MSKEMKDWQLGYSLEELKEAAAPFKNSIKKFCYGAFGCPKERDVATAKKANQYWRRGKAAAIAKTLKSSSNRWDFAGRPIPMAAGDVIVSAWGWNDGGREEAKQLIKDSLVIVEMPKEKKGLGLDENVIWVEIHEERKDAKKILLDLGFKWVVSKVSAGSDVLGLYCWGPGLERAQKAAPVTDAAEAACIVDIFEKRFITEEQQESIREELEGVRQHFAQHYSSYNKRHSWTAFALKGFDTLDPTFIIKPEEMARKWKGEHPERMDAKCDWTVLAEMMPETMKVVRSLPGGEPDRVRFMRLAPHGELTRHADITDRDAGVADGKLARLHIPIRTDAGCTFQSWTLGGEEHKGHMPLGHLCYLDQRKPHAAKMESSEERIHLVSDIATNPELRAMIVAASPIKETAK